MKPVSGNYCSHHLSSTKNHNFLSIVNYHEFTSTFSDALMEVKITMNLVDEQTLLNCNFCGYNAWVSQQFSKQSLSLSRELRMINEHTAKLFCCSRFSLSKETESTQLLELSVKIHSRKSSKTPQTKPVRKSYDFQCCRIFFAPL